MLHTDKFCLIGSTHLCTWYSIFTIVLSSNINGVPEMSEPSSCQETLENFLKNNEFFSDLSSLFPEELDNNIKLYEEGDFSEEPQEYLLDSDFVDFITMPSNSVFGTKRKFEDYEDTINNNATAISCNITSNDVQSTSLRTEHLREEKDSINNNNNENSTCVENEEEIITLLQNAHLPFIHDDNETSSQKCDKPRILPAKKHIIIDLSCNSGSEVLVPDKIDTLTSVLNIALNETYIFNLLSDIIKNIFFCQYNLSYFFCYHLKNTRLKKKGPLVILENLTKYCFEFGKSCHTYKLPLQYPKIDINLYTQVKSYEQKLINHTTTYDFTDCIKEINYIKQYNKMIVTYNKNVFNKLFQNLTARFAILLGFNYKLDYYFYMFFAILNPLYKISLLFDEVLKNSLQQNLTIPGQLSTYFPQYNLNKECHFFFYCAFYWMFTFFNYEAKGFFCKISNDPNTLINDISTKFYIQSIIIFHGLLSYNKPENFIFYKNENFYEQWKKNIKEILNRKRNDKGNNFLVIIMGKFFCNIKNIYEPKIFKNIHPKNLRVMSTVYKNIDIASILNYEVFMLLKLIKLVSIKSFEKTKTMFVVSLSPTKP